jgi:hypothetical protein
VFIRCRIAMDSSGVELSGVLSEIGTAVADETVLVTGYTCNALGWSTCMCCACVSSEQHTTSSSTKRHHRDGWRVVFMRVRYAPYLYCENHGNGNDGLWISFQAVCRFNK